MAQLNQRQWELDCWLAQLVGHWSVVLGQVEEAPPQVDQAVVDLWARQQMVGVVSVWVVLEVVDSQE